MSVTSMKFHPILPYAISSASLLRQHQEKSPSQNPQSLAYRTKIQPSFYKKGKKGKENLRCRHPTYYSQGSEYSARSPRAHPQAKSSIKLINPLSIYASRRQLLGPTWWSAEEDSRIATLVYHTPLFDNSGHTIGQSGQVRMYVRGPHFVLRRSSLFSL